LALLSETLLAVLLVYTPGMDVVLMTRPVKPIWLLPALPFAVLIVVKNCCS
jgi:sodium/potassium-transporting ATPase subunit alpha